MRDLLDKLGITLEAYAAMSDHGKQILATVDAEQITDADLAVFHDLFTAEQYRRAQLAALPGQISELRERYTRLGGDASSLGA